MVSKKTQRMIVVLFFIMLLSAFTVCTATTQKPTEKKFVLKFAAVSVPGDAHTEAMFRFAQEVERLSQGSIKVRVYHSGTLYSADAEPEALFKGEIEMAYLSPSQISSYIPYFNMFTAGYFFKDYNHMTKTFNGELARTKMYKDIEEKLGVVPLAAYYLGSRQINTRNKAINSPEDMKGLLLRMPNTPAWLFLGKALGANPTPMAFTEVYTGLSTGAIDAQDNPLPTIKNAKFYEVTKYIALTYHVIDSVWPMVNKKVWEQMSDAQKEAMYQAAELAREQCDQQNIKAEAELVKFFEEKGLKVTKPDVNKFKAQVQEAYLKDPEMSKTWDMDLYKQIQALAN